MGKFNKFKEYFVKLYLIVLIFIICILCFWLGCEVGTHYDGFKYDGWLIQVQNQDKQITDRVNDSDILFTEDVLIIKGLDYYSGYANTNSMLPILDSGSTGFYYYVNEYTELFVGDIVSYYVEWRDSYVIHRIIGIGQDEQGLYYITKGDNLVKEDPYKVRQEQIKGVLVGIIW